MKRSQGIPAAAFMAVFSSAGRGVAGPEVEVDNHPAFAVVERWDGRKWIAVRLAWNGAAYQEQRNHKCSR